MGKGDGGLGGKGGGGGGGGRENIETGRTIIIHNRKWIFRVVSVSPDGASIDALIYISYNCTLVFRSCVTLNVEVTVMGPQSLTVRTVPVEVKQH